jgi:RNA polymerase sigma-70 factor (ECF subfamily)
VEPRLRAQIDGALVRLAEGDRSAFDSVFAALWPIVLALSTRLLGSPADAEDASQQAMLKVFGRINEFEVGRSGTSWVLGIVAWECRAVRTYRRRRREFRVDGAAEISSDDPSPETDMMNRELIAAAQDALGELSLVDQEALRAAFGDSRVAGGPTIRKRRERALARLRDIWRRHHGTY